LKAPRCCGRPTAAVEAAADSAQIHFGNAISTGAAALQAIHLPSQFESFLFIFEGDRPLRCQRPARSWPSSKVDSY